MHFLPGFHLAARGRHSPGPCCKGYLTQPMGHSILAPDKAEGDSQALSPAALPRGCPAVCSTLFCLMEQKREEQQLSPGAGWVIGVPAWPSSCWCCSPDTSLNSSRERPSGSDLINLYNFMLCLNWISCRGWFCSCS